jgi:hypothetical protein
MLVANAPTPVNLSILSPPSLDSPSPAHQSLSTVDQYNSAPGLGQGPQDVPQLASSLSQRQITPENSPVALNSEGVLQDHEVPASPLRKFEEDPTKITASLQISAVSNARDRIEHNNRHSATRYDPTLLDSNEEFDLFKASSSILSMQSLRISASKSSTASIYSGLSRDPRSECSIKTNWSDKNGLTTDQWSACLEIESQRMVKDVGKAIHDASFNGDTALLTQLLGKTADVNNQGGYYGNALQAASSRGHEMIVKLLLDKGADVNA